MNVRFRVCRIETQEGTFLDARHRPQPGPSTTFVLTPVRNWEEPVPTLAGEIKMTVPPAMAAILNLGDTFTLLPDREGS